MKISVFESMKLLTVKDIIILVLTLVLGVTIFKCSRNQEHLNPGFNHLGLGNKPDTVYKTVTSFKPVSAYRFTTLPKVVTVYVPDSAKSSKTFKPLAIQDLDPLSQRDSITQILLSKNQLRITSQQDSIILDKVFGLNLDTYKYNYTQGKLTKKLNWDNILGGYTSISYRPFNNLWDLDIGAKIKTKSLQYKAGINLYYYPKYDKGLGTDFKFSIQYNF